MYLSSRCTNISTEFYIQKCGNGVKLVRPEEAYRSILLPQVPRSLADAAHHPLSLCLLNTESEVIGMNALGANMGGFTSERDVVGKSLFDLFERKNAEVLRRHDLDILKANKTCIAEQETINSAGNHIHHLTIDAPWYSDTNDIVGMIGFSVVIGQWSIEPILNYLSSLGLLSPTIPTSCNNIILTKREQSCVDQLLYGRSCKQIAKMLQISPRTVEHSIERVKLKFGVKTKFELIDALRK